MKKKKKFYFAVTVIFLLTNISLQAQEQEESGSRAYWATSGNALQSNHDFIGTTNNKPLIVKTNNTLRMFIDTLGNIGLNTMVPYQMLHVVDGNILITGSSDRAPGSYNGSILFGCSASSDNQYGQWGIEYVSNENEGYGLNFWRPWAPGQLYGDHFLFLADSGNVGIGTKNPQAKLAVNGDILAKSIRVNTSSTYWPDYVFENDYQLMSIEELDAYIALHHHLPNIPSAKEIEEKGEVNMEEMNAMLLEKVEELTRYVIDLQKQIDELKNGKE